MMLKIPRIGMMILNIPRNFALSILPAPKKTVPVT